MKKKKDSNKKTAKNSVKNLASLQQETDVNDEHTEILAPVLEFATFTDEAFGWMVSQDSIPGAFSPILYVGQQNCDLIAKALGRSIVLSEAQLLVQPDGGITECAWDTLKGVQT